MKGITVFEVLIDLVVFSMLFVVILATGGFVRDAFIGNVDENHAQGVLNELAEGINTIPLGGSAQIPYSLKGSYYLIGKSADVSSIESISRFSEVSKQWSDDVYPECKGKSCLCLWKFDGGDPVKEGGFCRVIDASCISIKAHNNNLGKGYLGNAYLFYKSESPGWFLVQRNQECEGDALLFTVQ